MGKLVQMNRYKASSRKNGARATVALKKSAAEPGAIPSGKTRPTGDLVLFTGVRYERRNSTTPTPVRKIIANNNIKSG